MVLGYVQGRGGQVLIDSSGTLKKNIKGWVMLRRDLGDAFVLMFFSPQNNNQSPIFVLD